jgi:hypothetical protein
MKVLQARTRQAYPMRRHPRMAGVGHRMRVHWSRHTGSARLIVSDAAVGPARPRMALFDFTQYWHPCMVRHVLTIVLGCACGR